MDMSLPAANFWFNLSNIILLVGALLVAIGTYGVFKTGAIKERYGDERISFNESETAKAQSSAAKANESAETVRQSNIVLQTDLERERAARLKLENKLAPRRFDQSQSQAFVQAIKPYAGQKVDVFIPLGDTEAKTYAAEFVRSFREAGWDPGEKDGINQGVYTGIPRGITVIISQADQGMPPRSALQLAESLKSLGLLNDTIADPQRPAGSVELLIGAKID